MIETVIKRRGQDVTFFDYMQHSAQVLKELGEVAVGETLWYTDPEHDNVIQLVRVK